MIKKFAIMGLFLGLLCSLSGNEIDPKKEAKPAQEEEGNIKTIEEMADAFYVMTQQKSIALLLSLKGEDDLERVSKELDDLKAQMEKFFVDLQKYPAPDKATKLAINKRMEKQMDEEQKERSEKFENHMSKIPQHLRSAIQPKIRGFYGVIGKNRELMGQYFSVK